MSHITLHPTKGVNPYLTYCPRCKGDGPELILIGIRDTVYECDRCKMKLIGTSICPEHGSVGIRIRTLRDHEKLPGSLCDACEKELEEFKKVVEAGGVLWKCDTCGRSGALRASCGLAAQAREMAGVPAPDPCGIDFTGQSNCPGCYPSD